MVKPIKPFPQKNRLFAAIKRRTIKKFHDNNSVIGECVLINTRRIYYLSLIAIPLCILDIHLFSSSGSYDTPVSKTWSQWIIAVHLTMLILVVGFFLAALKLKNRKKPNTAMYVLQYAGVGFLMAAGIVIVTIDQLVTTNITPFILVCIIIGAVFLIRPLISIIIYAISFLAYYYAIAFTVTNPQILLSNRVNGITAITIGLFLSLILWYYNYINITQKRRIEIQQKHLEQMAYYDSLTGLPNRRFLEELIKREFALMHRYDHETVIVILDIDNFKNINDTYGHPVGDNILKQLADLLRNNARETDTVSRFGGEEFIILMPNISLEGGYAFAERLRKIILEESFVVGTLTLRITASFGVSSLRDVEDENLENYYSLADKALYLAKKSGKNRVEVIWKHENRL